MENKVLIAEPRSTSGSIESRRIRRAKRIPAVLYGKGGAQSISIDAKEFDTAFRVISENELIELTIGKKKHTVLIKDYQSDILKNRVTHLDFYEVETNKPVKTRVPVRLQGSPKGVKEGGILENPQHELEIECLPADLPEFIDVDIADLDAGKAIHVADLKLGDKIRILTNPETVIAAVGHARASEEAEEGEASAEGAEA